MCVSVLECLEESYGLSGELRLLRCVVYIVFSVLIVCVCAVCVWAQVFVNFKVSHLKAEHINKFLCFMILHKSPLLFLPLRWTTLQFDLIHIDCSSMTSLHRVQH